ncbi:MAG TPA: hypothetical protein VG294_13155 [Solirubrobacteraceae bacterium]|jgi:hypothetical protein|nr:hypothetical protein [Solirubrobacteraceae bacterium]
MAETEQAQGARRPRSPGYPATDLKTAIERVVELYKVSPRHPVPLSVASEEWGFSPKSSSSKVVAAALKRFGFVQDVGNGENRQLALTDEGRELAFATNERDTARWRELVRDAALRPKIHRQVLDQFDGSLPDDRVVLRYLLFDLGFADETSAKGFLSRLRSTLDFAGVPAPLDAADEAEESADALATDIPEGRLGTSWAAPAEGPAERVRNPEPPQISIYDQFRADRTIVQIPYSHGAWAMLQAAFPLTEREWDALISMLQAMKPGLVTEPERS